MIKNFDVIGYKSKNDFRSIVLIDLLKFFTEKSQIQIVKLPSKKANKIAEPLTSDLESDKILHEIFNGDFSKLKKMPVDGKIIKPLYLFLDREVLLYAKLKRLKFDKLTTKKDKLSRFIDDLEEKHPEIKHSIISSYLEIFNK